MSTRIDSEVELIAKWFPSVERLGDWLRIPDYQTPPGVWDLSSVALAITFPPGYPGNPPYGFHVMPALTAADGRAALNTTPSAEPPWPGTWTKFSWSLPEWRPTADLQSGFNMLNFVLTIANRLAEGA